MTEPDFRPPQQQRTRAGKRGMGTTQWLLIALAIAAAGYGAWYAREHWSAQQRMDAPVVAKETASQAVVPNMPEPIADAPEVADSVQATDQVLKPIENPIEVPAANALAPDDGLGLDRLAGEWLGQQALKFLVMPGLAHHIVATVDNLPRSHAAPRLWPLYPVGGKMQLTQSAQGMQIADANSARYDAVVSFVTEIAPVQAASWYRQAYPALQQAYENLGYPGQHFNDRVVAVIDHLLQTPEPEVPMTVHWIQVQSQDPAAPPQPWLRYEFVDASLQTLSAGQKILLRVGAEHRQRLKAYLQALRSQIAA